MSKWIIRITALDGQYIFNCRTWMAIPLLMLALAGQALSQEPEDIDDLRRKLELQEELLLKQGELLKTQQDEQKLLMEQIENLKKRLSELEQARVAPTPSPTPPAAGSQASERDSARDSIGDLNAESVAAGTFPGSFVIPGSRDVSLAIGGFVKTVAIADSDAEGFGSNLLPSGLGTQHIDTRGKFAIDSTLTRLFLDARAPARSGSLRGYIEYDLNANNNNSLGFKLRHAYGNWQSGIGTLTMGHTWSTLMDLKILPEGLTEPTVSGAIFMRQAQLRWTGNFGENLYVHLSIEHPSGADIHLDDSSDPIFQSRTKFPDFIAAVEYGNSKLGHVRFGGIVRNMQLASLDDSVSLSATGWGLSLGAHLESFGKDRLAFSGSYGSGLGRYLLGLGSTAGGIFDPVDSSLRLQDNYGGLIWYQHYWSSSLRSTGAVGHARSQPFDNQPGNTFESTTYAYGNLMWTVLPYLNVGFEYDFGRRTVKDGSDKDNHRLMLGMQIF